MIKKLKKIYAYFNKNKILLNVNRSHHKKNVLISYITHPHTNRHKEAMTHTNIPESLVISRVFDELGYNCDIINNNCTKKINYDKYDVIFGFGHIFEKSFDSIKKVFRIYYGTGKHPYFSNIETIRRGLDFKKRKGIFLTESLRLIREDYALQTTASNSLIIIGGKTESQTYQKYTDIPIYNINVSFFKIHDYIDIVNKKDFIDAKKNYLFFSGGGLIHKGLDILIEAFSNQKDYHLHICAPINSEIKFKEIYNNEILDSDYIHLYNFIDLKSDVFKELLTRCAFVILPSCSEAMPTSVVNVVGNGGLIPILANSSTINIDELTIPIKELTIDSIIDSIKYSQTIKEDKLREMSMEIGETVNRNYSIENYFKNIKSVLNKILYQNEL